MAEFENLSLIEIRAKNLKRQIKLDEIKRKLTQQQLSEIIFAPIDMSSLHIDYDKYFEDY